MEMLAWCALPVAFLIDYIGVHGRPLRAAGFHLAIIALLAVSVILLKTLALRLMPRKYAVALFAAVYAGIALLLAGYYVTVHIVLGVWGKVVSAELISSYVPQASYLCEVVGIPFPLMIALICASYAGLYALCRWALDRFAWPWQRPARRGRLFNMLLLSMAVFTVSQLPGALGRDGDQEPFGMTLHAGANRSKLTFSQGLDVPLALNERDAQLRRSYRPSPALEKPNLVLIVLDALRVDHMSVYGYARDTTPYLRELDRQGKLALSSQTRATCSESTCAMASLVSGRYSHLVPPQPFTLHQVLKRHGYRIRMVLGDNLSNIYRPEDLFGKVDDYFDGGMARGWYMNDDGFILQRTAAMPAWDGQPTLLQLHLMATHTLGQRAPQYQRFAPVKKYAGSVSGQPDQRYTNYYDNGVVQGDAELKVLLATLADKGYLRDALVVITSDHGESLGEHGLFSHTNSVYEQVLHIPLMYLRFKNDVAQAARHIDAFNSQVDIAPTILQQFGMPIPASWAGLPLASARKADFTFYQMDPYLGLYDHRASQHLWKYWIDTRHHKEYAFDVMHDPKEEHELLAAVPAALKASWRAQLDAASLMSR
ncbi:MAG: sulfatase-like hydrolase/transferase [Pseudomonadota bacterium]